MTTKRAKVDPPVAAAVTVTSAAAVPSATYSTVTVTGRASSVSTAHVSVSQHQNLRQSKAERRRENQRVVDWMMAVHLHLNELQKKAHFCGDRERQCRCSFDVVRSSMESAWSAIRGEPNDYNDANVIDFIAKSKAWEDAGRKFSLLHLPISNLLPTYQDRYRDDKCWKWQNYRHWGRPDALCMDKPF